MAKKKLTKEQSTLVSDKDVLDFINRVAKHFGKKNPSVGAKEFYSIGVETAIRYVGGYDAKKGKPFLHYISKYIVCEMRQYVRQEVYDIHQEDKKISCSKVVLIEQMNLRGGRKGDEYYTAEEKLGMLVPDQDDERKKAWDILEPLLAQLSEEERELILTRYGFFDNQGETIKEYVRKHGMDTCTFYRKARAILLKLQRIARENN